MQSGLKERVRMLVGAMGDDEFERFMSDLLPRIFPGFENLEPSFNFIGKTTKGKCDAHVYHAGDDTYTAIVCTTRQSDIHTKVLDDIQKLAVTKFASKIRRVLLCVNTPVKDEVEEYRTACIDHGWELDALSLERITQHTLAFGDILEGYFGRLLEYRQDSNAPTISRRFDCGSRIKEAREDLALSPSQLIEKIDFPSEKEWKAIEASDLEVTEKVIDRLCNLGGISSSWLKHGISPKYPCETIYDYQSEKISSIASESPVASYMAIEPEGMEVLLIVRYSEFRWQVFPFGFSMNFWEWVGDEHHIPIIFRLLAEVDRSLNHPYGRVISKSLLKEFYAGTKHPAQLFKQAGVNNYWFDDLFDLYHRFPIAEDKYAHYGNWFVQLQDSFRHYVKQDAISGVRFREDV